MEEKLKVLVITNLFPNGKEPNRGIFIKQELLELAKLVELQVVAPVPWFPFKSSLFRKWAFNRGIKAEENINGIKVYHPRWFVSPKIFRSLYGFFFYFSIKGEIEKIRKKFAFEIIYTPWIYPDGFASTLLARKFKKPLVLHARGCDINLYTKYYIRRKLIQWCLKKASKTIVVSEALSNKIESLNVLKGKIAIIRNGIDTNIFKPLGKNKCKTKLDILKYEKVVLFIGSLDEVKGTRYLLEAFLKINTINKKVHLIIIGKGYLKQDIIEFINKNMLNEYVQFADEIKHEDIPLWINSSDVLCLPSIREGMPNVILESLACGTPVVASDIGGIPEIISSDKYGILVPPGNADLLARAIIEAINRSWDVDTLKDHIKPFTWENCAKECFQELLIAIKNYGNKNER